MIKLQICIPAIFIFTFMLPSQATDFHPVSPPATGVQGAGGDASAYLISTIQQDPNLPEDAKHIDVLYQNGATVLRGTVNTSREKQIIGNLAAQCGCTNIKNEIVVKTKK